MGKSCALKAHRLLACLSRFADYLILTLVLSGTCVAGDIYKWTDAEGNVHYGDKPDADNASTLELRSPTPQLDDEHQRRQDKTKRLLDTFAAEREERDKARAEAAREKREREERCARAREVLLSYERAGFLYDEDEDGNRRVLSDEEHTKAHQEARDFERDACAR